MSVATPTYIAELEDNSLRWVRPDFGGLLDGCPDRGWFERGLRSKTRVWEGNSIMLPPPEEHRVLLNTLNRALSS